MCGLWEFCAKHRPDTELDGPFLFGKDFTIADAIFAPVVMRFRTYQPAGLTPFADTYCESVMDYPAVDRWMDNAEEEQSVIGAYLK